MGGPAGKVDLEAFNFQAPTTGSEVGAAAIATPVAARRNMSTARTIGLFMFVSPQFVKERREHRPWRIACARRLVECDASVAGQPASIQSAATDPQPASGC